MSAKKSSSRPITRSLTKAQTQYDVGSNSDSESLPETLPQLSSSPQLQLSPYLLVCKYVDLFRTTVNKVMLFKSGKAAYDYGLTLEKHLNKGCIYSYDEAMVNKVIWKTNNHDFPTYICEMIFIDSDLLCNIYQGADESRRLIEYIYMSLRINKIIN